MSCLENDRAYEKALEIFTVEYLDNYDFRCTIQSFFTTEEQWMEKEYGGPCEDAYDRVFDELWKEDMEAMFYDPIGTTIKAGNK